MKHEQDVFEEVLALVRTWQDRGRSGFSLPVIRGELLDKLEDVIEKREDAENAVHRMEKET